MTIHAKGKPEPIDRPPLVLRFRGCSPEPGYIYLIHGESTPWYKIGTASKPHKRLGEISAQAPFAPVLIKAFYVKDVAGEESYWHSRFGDKRVRGEWFTLSESDVLEFCGAYHEHP